MLTVLFAAKGGQGVTTVAAAAAAEGGKGLVVIDTAGDVHAALGVPEPAGPGLAGLLGGDWPIDAGTLAKTASATSDPPVVPCGRALDGLEPRRWTDLASTLSADRRRWLVDAGTGPAVAMATVADRALLVTRNCFLALRYATRLTSRPTGVVVVREHHRALSEQDVERVVGAPVVAIVDVDPSIARATDAGVLTGRVPARLRRALAGVIDQTGR